MPNPYGTDKELHAGATPYFNAHANTHVACSYNIHRHFIFVKQQKQSGGFPKRQTHPALLVAGHAQGWDSAGIIGACKSAAKLSKIITLLQSLSGVAVTVAMRSPARQAASGRYVRPSASAPFASALANALRRGSQR